MTKKRLPSESLSIICKFFYFLKLSNSREFSYFCRIYLIIIVMKRFFMAACAAAALAGCAGVSDVTKISGEIMSEGIDEVNVIIPDAGIDTLVPVVNGKFYIEVLADPTIFGSIQAADYGTEFVPDGTSLKVVLGSEPTVTSKAGDKSVQMRYNEYKNRSMEMQNDLRASIEQISADESLTDDDRTVRLQTVYDSAISGYKEYNTKVLDENKDNILALFAVQNIAMDMEDPQLDSLLSTLSEKLQQNEFVVNLRESIKVRENTAEGKMFTDFTVSDSDGKSVSLSDYVGKGKYVLVDFWASWCNPCKEEIPNIRAVYDKYRSKGLDVLSVAVWDNPESTRDTAKVYGVKWNQIVNAQSVPTEIYGIEGIPHIILFGPDGTILKRNLRGEDIEKTVAEYLD